MSNILKKLTLATMGHNKSSIRLLLKPMADAHEKALVEAKSAADPEMLTRVMTDPNVSAEEKQRVAEKAKSSAADLLRLEATTIKVDLAKIVGQTTAAMPGQSTMGDYIKLAGSFTCINLQDGEMSTSSICIMPNYISEPVAAALKETSQVEFAVKIFAKHSPTSAVGYEFGVESLMETKPTESMQRLLALAGIAPQAAALEAPAAPAAADAAQAPVASPSKKK